MANLQNPFQGLSKNQKIAAGIGGAAVAGYIIWRHLHPGAQAPATVTAADATGDPTLGYTSAGNAAGYSYGTPITGAAAQASTTAAQTPSDWIQAAEQGLVNDLGYDPGAVQAAFAAWVSGGQLTAAQAAIIHAAVTEFPGGPAYPIRLAPASGGTPPATGAAAPAGLSVTPTGTGFNAGWGAVPGASEYELSIKGAGGHGTGTSSYDRTTTATHATGQARLSPGAYYAVVRARTPAGWGPWSAPRPFTVTRQ